MEGEGGGGREGERMGYGAENSTLWVNTESSALSYLEGEVGRRARGRRVRGREVGRRAWGGERVREVGRRERGRKVRMRDWGGEKREKDGERGREVILLIKEVCEGQ